MRQHSLIGKTLRNRYQILQKIGEGGFGVTYRAIDSDLPGQPVCIAKHFKPKNSHPGILKIAEEKFNQEAQTLYRLGNANKQIPSLFAHFEENGQFYLVQEFVDGYDLIEEVFSNYHRKEQEVLQLLKEILEVLAFVHQQNVIHRDIKPQNIMRRKDGKIVLIDFGAVKEIAGLGVNPGEISQTVAIGTPGYMPREQQSGYPNFSSDIYAVGIIGFQALTGLYRNPLELPQDYHTKELYCALFPECEISPAFAEILDKMVRYDNLQRYKNAAVALEAVNNLLKLEQTTTVVVPSPNLNTTVQNNQNTDIRSNSSIQTEPSLFQKIIGFFRDLLSDEPEFPPTILPNPTVNSNSYEQPEGQVSLNSAFYIARPPIENDCYETILQPGALIRIKAPRQMGKTSLLSRTLDYAKKQGCQAAYLNLQSADAEFLDSLDKFLQWFCGSIAQELNLPDNLAEHWQGVLGSKNKCTNYFQRYLLSEIKSPVVLGLDEVDQLFQHPQVAAEFFGLLRAWHEKSKNQATWQKLRLAIAHSKEVYIPLNINQSPFNVGLPIELPEFNQSQVQDLVQRYQLDWGEEEIKQLMAMVGGHPYLVRKSLYEIARDRISLSQFLQIAPTEQGMFSDHLRRHLSNLREDDGLVLAIKQVIGASQPVRLDTNFAFKLRSMGLVKFQGNDVIPLCDLYSLYLRERL